MWLILQQEQPDDYVIATGHAYTVREFVQRVFTALELNWEGYVEIDPRYIRPSEVEHLLGPDMNVSQKQVYLFHAI